MFVKELDWIRYLVQICFWLGLASLQRKNSYSELKTLNHWNLGINKEVS